MREYWYYEYEVTVMEDHEEVVRRGVLCADSWSGAASELDEFYGTELIRIQKLFCVADGLYEFNGYDTEFKIHVEA